MTLFTDKAPPIMVTLMADFGLSKEDAAAILGNIGHESGGFTAFQEKKPVAGRGGWGWCQWTGPRREAFEAYCTRNKLDPMSDKANYGWLFCELSGNKKAGAGDYRSAIKSVKAASGLHEKVVAFEETFERAGVKNYSSRYDYADQALTAYLKLAINNKLVPLFPVGDPTKTPTKTEPPWMTLARSQIGQKEIAGSKDNPTIAAFYKDVTGKAEHDEVAWCAAFVGSMLKRAGYPNTGSLAARSYLTYGTKLDTPIPGCIVVYWRDKPTGWQGHVQFFTRKVGSTVYGIGGNQSNSVSEAGYSASQVLGYRWPPGAPLPGAEPVQPPAAPSAPEAPSTPPVEPAGGFWHWVLVLLGLR